MYNMYKAGGWEPGLILLAEEYNFGICLLSREHRRHSVSPLGSALILIPGNLSRHVMHRGICRKIAEDCLPSLVPTVFGMCILALYFFYIFVHADFYTTGNSYHTSEQGSGEEEMVRLQWFRMQI